MEIFGNDNGLVHCIRISSLPGSCFQLQSNFEGGNLFDRVFPQTRPAWKALLLICSFRPSLDGGSFLRLSLAEWTYSWYLASFTGIFDSLLTYKVATNRSKASVVAVSVSKLGSQLSCWNVHVISSNLSYPCQWLKKEPFDFSKKDEVESHPVKEWKKGNPRHSDYPNSRKIMFTSYSFQFSPRPKSSQARRGPPP